MSIGNNLNIKGKKASKSAAAEPSEKKEKVVVEPVQNQEEHVIVEPVQKEETAVMESTDAEKEKLQVINESAAGMNLPSTDMVAQQRRDADSPMIAEGQNMLIVFPVGEEEYAISIDDIKEVVPTPPIALIPQVPDFVMGVANVRGNVLAVIDLAKKFSTKITDDEIGKFVLVIKNEEIKIAVNVLNVPNTMIVKDSEVESPTNVISNSGIGSGHIKGIIKKDRRMIIWIDIHEVMESMYTEETT